MRNIGENIFHFWKCCKNKNFFFKDNIFLLEGWLMEKKVPSLAERKKKYFCSTEQQWISNTKFRIILIMTTQVFPIMSELNVFYKAVDRDVTNSLSL